MEDVDERDVRVAREQIEHLPVPAGLVILARVVAEDAAGSVAAHLGARVSDPAAAARLDAGLVQAHRHSPTRLLADRLLGGAAEGVVERLVDPREVRHARLLRIGVPLGERLRLRDGVGMEVEAVHDPLHPPRLLRERLEPRTQRREERDRLGRGVAEGVRAVVAARREAEPDHVDRRVDVLERVVADRQCLLVGRGGNALSAHELRLPEPRLIRLVPDDEVLHLRVGPREERGISGEELGSVWGRDDVGRVSGLDAEEDPRPEQRRLRHRPVEEDLLLDRRRLGRVPEDDDPVLRHPEIAERRKERRAAVVRVLARVLGDAERDLGARGPGECEHEAEQEDGREPFHPHPPRQGGATS